MENLCVNGDYVPDGFGGFTRLQGTQALLQRALFKLCCKRGSFPFLPDLGSQLHLLGREKPSVRQALARQYAAEALADETDLTVTGAELSGNGTLKVTLEREGQTAEVVVSL